MSKTALQLPVTYLPWRVGGKEVHTDRLSRGLQMLGWDPHVAIHQDLDGPEPLGPAIVEGVPLTVLPPIEGQIDRRSIYRRCPTSIPGFSRLLDEVEPDVVHFHDFSVGANVLHMREAARLGIPSLLTFHSPGQSCLQTSLLYRGRDFCDGRIDVTRCTECRLNVSGVPFLAARILASPPFSGRNFNGKSRVARVLSGREMTELFVDAWQEMIEEMRFLIVHSKWQEEILLLNGVDADKIRIIPNGIDVPPVKHKVAEPDAPLRIAFVGRCEAVKGPQVLVDAVLRLPESIALEVHLFGPYWDSAFGHKLREKMRDDPRFREPRMLQPREVIPVVAEMDLCVIPPTWVEVDPQILLESFAAGTPVVGSSGYGISERVRDGVDGVLFPPGDDAELSRLIASLALDRDRLAQLTAAVRQPRSILEMASDVIECYAMPA